VPQDLHDIGKADAFAQGFRDHYRGGGMPDVVEDEVVNT
jgi:hypothetical protein